MLKTLLSILQICNCVAYFRYGQCFNVQDVDFTMIILLYCLIIYKYMYKAILRSSCAAACYIVITPIRMVNFTMPIMPTCHDPYFIMFFSNNLYFIPSYYREQGSNNLFTPRDLNIISFIDMQKLFFFSFINRYCQMHLFCADFDRTWKK